MSISIDLIKQLRDETMASLKDCKECLIEASGDISQARELLKKKGLAAASKKADREVKEGLVKFISKNSKLVGVGLGCETDFVAKNEMFIATVDNILDILSQLDGDIDGGLDILSSDQYDKIQSMINELIAKLGENMKVVFVVSKTLSDNDVYIYTHLTGKLVSVVLYKKLSDEASDVAKMLALQSAAMDPLYNTIDQVSQDILEDIKIKTRDELQKTNKPDSVIDNIISGKINKRYSENVLLEQSYIGDETQKMKNIINNKIDIVAVMRYAI